MEARLPGDLRRHVTDVLLTSRRERLARDADLLLPGTARRSAVADDASRRRVEDLAGGGADAEERGALAVRVGRRRPHVVLRGLIQDVDRRLVERRLERCLEALRAREVEASALHDREPGLLHRREQLHLGLELLARHGAIGGIERGSVTASVAPVPAMTTTAMASSSRQRKLRLGIGSRRGEVEADAGALGPGFRDPVTRRDGIEPIDDRGTAGPWRAGDARERRCGDDAREMSEMRSRPPDDESL